MLRGMFLMEAEMRVAVATFVGVAALAAVSVQAAPIPSQMTPIELGVAPPVELVAGGCGPGWHRHHWRDHWGYWHADRCVPN